MPLSEHEQRLLDQIEQALYADDPKFAASVRSVRRRGRSRRALPLAIAGAVLGLGLVLVGLISNVVAVSVVGFVMLVGSSGIAVHRLRSRSTEQSDPTPGSTRRPNARAHGGIRSRMEDRLRRRFDEN